MNTPGASGKRSYYELIAKTTIQFELYQIALLLTLAFIYFYDSNAFDHTLSMLMQWGMPKGTAEKLLVPTPYFVMGVILVVYFIFRTSGFQPAPSDWRKIKEYVNEEKEFTDFFTGKKVKRKRRLVGFIVGALCLIADISFLMPDLWVWYSSQWDRAADFTPYHVSLYEVFGVLIFPSIIFFFFRVFVSRGGEV